ncbi:MAG TPA: DUF2169 domain-containing protein [Minicystis sp.]|nr:DUF2169 domain-containing protein [Minicystis sp.]
MELTNRTPLSAYVAVTDADQQKERLGLLVAKATFTFAEGQAELETQHPLPVQLEDGAHAHGVLPCEVVPRHTNAFELGAIAAAYSEEEAPVARRDVAITIGAERRELVVFGDRRWEPDATGALSPGAPEPFTRMPIAWDRALGGSASVEIDEESFLELRHPLNPAGRGARLDHLVDAVARDLGVQPPRPTWTRDLRMPNVESKASPLERYGDEPLPVCWAPVPSSSPLLNGRTFEILQRRDTSADVYVGESLLRTHRDFVLAAPPRGAVCLEGLAPGPPLRFPLRLPDVWIDFDGHAGVTTLRAMAHAMLLLVDERRYAVTYRLVFRLASRAGCARLRLSEG